MTVARSIAFLLTALAFLSLSNHAYADSFGSGANTFDIEFVPIGNPGNVADTTGAPNPAGSVPYTYRIGKYEISEQMIDKANALGGLGISKDTRGDDKPATRVSWIEAARFVNWLNTSTGNAPAYKFPLLPGEPGYISTTNIQLWDPADAGYNPYNRYRNSLAKYFLPSVDEWYKAAYFDPINGVYYDYPTGSDSVPTAVASGTAAGSAVYGQSSATGPADITLAGGLSPYGTAGQGGNANELEETAFDLVNDSTFFDRGIRGGYWAMVPIAMHSSIRFHVSPASKNNGYGFRVASVAIPEPTSLLLGALASVGVLLRRRG